MTTPSGPRVPHILDQKIHNMILEFLSNESVPVDTALHELFELLCASVTVVPLVMDGLRQAIFYAEGEGE